MKIFLFKLFAYYRNKKRIFLKGIKREYYTWQVRTIAASCGDGLKVNGFSTVNSQTMLGNNVNFNGMTITGQGKVSIGNNFHSGIGCRIITSNHNYNGNAIPYDDTFLHMTTVIEDNVWLGEYVTILGNVTIGEGAIIQARSVVVSDVPKLGIAGGHPAKVFNYRNSSNYYQLKELNRFH